MAIPTYAAPNKSTANIGDKIEITFAVFSDRYYWWQYFDVYLDGVYIGKTQKESCRNSYSTIEYIIPDISDDLRSRYQQFELKFVMRNEHKHDDMLTACSFVVEVQAPDPPYFDLPNKINIGIKENLLFNGIVKAFRCELSLLIGRTSIDICSFNYSDAVDSDDGEGLLIEDYVFRSISILLDFSYDIAKINKNQKEIPALFVCKTYANNYLYDTTEKSLVLVVPENDTTKPAIDSVKFSPITSCTDAMAPLYIRGKTGLNVQMIATSKYSDIAEYEVTAGSVGAKGNPGIIDVLANDGTVPVTVKVTDARGFSRTVTENIYVYPYSRPKIVPYSGYSDIVCERAKATGELHSDGTYLAIMAGKRFTSIMKDGAELNSCRLRYRFKPTTVDTFGDWVTLLADGSVESEIQVLAGNVVSSTNASYDIELSAIDRVGSEHVIRFSVMTSAISFVLYDGVDGAAFGKYPEEPHVVDIAAHMTLRVRGRLEVLGSSWASLGLADGMNESSYAYGRQDDTGCYYQVSNGNHVQAAFNCSYDYAGRSMVVNKTPIPEEYRPERTVCSICPTNDRRLALVTVQPDGYIRIEWVQTIASTSNTTSATVLWVDGYLDYWV